MNKILKVLKALLKALILPVIGGCIGFSSSYIVDFLLRHNIGAPGFDSFIVIALSCALMLGIIIIDHRLRHRRERRAMKQLLEDWGNQQKLFSDNQIPDRIAVNAALEQILATQGEDTASLETVIRFASRMEITNGFRPVNKPRPKGKTFFSGFTAEMGMVNLQTEDKPAEACALNENKTRVGGFKLWRTIDAIFFQNYWRSDFSTESAWTDPFEGWAICFDKDILAPRFFGELAFFQPLENIGRHTMIMYGIVVISGGSPGTFVQIGFFGSN